MMKMPLLLVLLLIGIATLLAPDLRSASALNVRGPLLKSQTYLSPPILLLPGSVSNKYYLDIPFPRGHLALKSFNAEVVDERGAPVPLHETYLHHWVVEPYYAPAGSKEDDAAKNGSAAFPNKVVMARNSGVCTNTLGQYYGLGSETRRTATWVPDPYGIEIGLPPAGHDERWLLNVHAIDTRGAVDRLGCTECRCALYNVTVDEYGRAIGEGYTGGLRCCYDGTRCSAALARGEQELARKVFLRYTVTWQDWSPAVLPVRIYIFDVTDMALLEGKPAGTACRVEYEVEEACKDQGGACVHVLETKQVLPRGGDVVFGVAHQHSGGIAASLRGDDGRLLCESVATYGDGEEPGNEAGYIVGMSTCYPTPGSVRVRGGEALTVVSNYSSERQHTGVMGLFYILVADHVEVEQQQKPGLCFSFPVSWCLPSWVSSNL
ncbi:hypothetical protein BS78_07G207900 [Paspalum vaginatum]|nr:hypothetical protein BS78_07G207900 [Paspalum vaginatum]